VKCYVLKRGNRYWTGFGWVPKEDIHKAMFFQEKVEAVCLGGDRGFGTIVPMNITFAHQEPKKQKKKLKRRALK